MKSEKIIRPAKSAAFVAASIRSTFESARGMAPQATSCLRIRLLALGAAFIALTAGCGSGGTQNLSLNPAGSAASLSPLGAGRAAISIRWPVRSQTHSRLIPEASNSIVVQMLRTVGGTGAIVQSQVVARPTDPGDGSAPVSTVTFTNLPIDTFTVIATAYPNADGSGIAQAIGSSSLTTIVGKSVGFGVTMSSTIDHLALTSAKATILVGTTLSLAATAYDGPDPMTASVILLSPGKLFWSAANAVVSVDGKGLVTAGTSPGDSTVTVTDSESGKSATAAVSVVTTLPPTVTDAVGPAQFNPNGTDYAGTLTDSTGNSPYTGGWNASGDTYQFDTGIAGATTTAVPSLTDTTTGKVIAYGKLVTQTFGQATTSITYAVFDFPGDINISGGKITAVTGTAGSNAINTNPLVLLTQGSFTIGGSASLNVSAVSPNSGAGGFYSGPGKSVSLGGGQLSPFYGSGCSFGGLGGGVSSGTYGTDFVLATAPHLQGGSSGGKGGGGAVYIGSVGLLTVNSASILANGSYSGSGGGIALFGGKGVLLTGATVHANGGAGSVTLSSLSRIPPTIVGGGGGGRIAIGYGSGSAPDTSGVISSGGTAPSGYATYKSITMAGRAGSIDSVTFSGF